MTTTIPHYRYIASFTKHGEAREVEVWTGSTDKNEIAGSVAAAHGLPAGAVTIRKATT